METYKRKKVPVRTAAIAGIARLECGLTSYEASKIFGKSIATLSNFETAVYAPADGTIRKILTHYLRELSKGLPTEMPGDIEGIGVEALTERLAIVLLLRKAQKVGELVALLENGGLDQCVAYVIHDGLRADIVNSKFAERMRRAIYQQRHIAKRTARELAAAAGQCPSPDISA